MRVPVNRAARQGERQVPELVVQLGTAGSEEVAIAGGDAGGVGQAGLRVTERIKAGQVARTVSGRVERGEQARQIHMRGHRLTAGHRVPERDRVAVHQQRLLDLLVNPDRRDACRGQPPGDAQFFLYPGQPVSRAGDPDHDRRGG